MRLKNLRLENYGVFQQSDIALSAQPGTIDLVVAPNGAGKSILRGALHDLLFGIHPQSPLDFRFGYKGMALHAEAVSADGLDFDFGWRKQGKRFFNSEPTQAGARLASAIGQISPRQLEHLFALDTQRLRDGGRELASGGDGLGVALLSGTGEMASARALRVALDQRRRALWEKGRSKPLLNAAVRELELARGRLREATEPPRDRAAREQAVEAARERRSNAEAAHRNALERARRLARIDRTRQPLQEMAEAEAWLAAHPDAPRLSLDLARALEKARADHSLSHTRLQSAEAQRDEQQAYFRSLDRDEAALAEQDALARLAERVKSVEDARRDLPKVEAEAAAADRRITGILADIGTGAPIEDPGSVLPPVAVLSTARALTKAHAACRSALDAAVGSRRQAEQDEADLQAAAPADDTAGSETAPLAALLSEIRSEGDPVRAAREAERGRLAARAELQKALALVPGPSADLAALRAATILPEASFERLARSLDEATTIRNRHAEAHGRISAERDKLARALTALREARVAEPARLAQARARRDQGWRLIQLRAFSHAPDDAAEQEYVAGETLPVRFERDLREADTIADERAADSVRVAEAERLDRELADRTPLADAASALQDATDAMQACQRAWDQATGPLGLGAGAGMAEVHVCLAARARALELASAADIAASLELALRQRHADFATRLAGLLGVPPDAELAALLASADRRLEAEVAAEKRRLELAANRLTARKNLTRAQQAVARAEAELDGWHGKWAATLSQLRRPLGEMPDATGAVLEALEELRHLVRENEARQPRIASMRTALDSFAEAARQLARRLGHVPDADPVVTARALGRRLQQALEGATRWEEARRALAIATDNCRTAADQHKAAGEALAALIAATGAQTGEEADARLAASADRVRMENVRAAARAALRAHGEGLDDAALRAQAAAIDPAIMATERDLADADAAQAGSEREAAAIALNNAETALEQAAATTAAVDAAAAHAAAASTVGRLLDEELVLRVASSMLARAMEAVEKNAGDDAISRISRAFAAVTDGDWSVTAEDNAGTLTLRARETAFPHQDPCAIDALSEGTRDQLYLALRMVALEDFTAVSPPLPFIADDVLQTFDDARALAALRALLALSRRVQVIILTHHNHLAELSRSLPAGSVFVRSLCA
jgi:uncharacterized protein YhaN